MLTSDNFWRKPVFYAFHEIISHFQLWLRGEKFTVDKILADLKVGFKLFRTATKFLRKLLQAFTIVNEVVKVSYSYYVPVPFNHSVFCPIILTTFIGNRIFFSDIKFIKSLRPTRYTLKSDTIVS